ncbi:MAG: hypothetical protein KDB69_03300, partial [Acidimicrobiia bacterium]|nr:hypothetical protein [Acidimicrobiia bacterium]
MSKTILDTGGTPPATTGPPAGRGRRVVRRIGWTLIGVGLFLLGFVGHQLFVTTWFAQQANETNTREVLDYFDAADVTEVPYVPPAEPGDPTPDPDPDQPAPTLLVEPEPDLHAPFAIIR